VYAVCSLGRTLIDANSEPGSRLNCVQNRGMVRVPVWKPRRSGPHSELTRIFAHSSSGNGPRISSSRADSPRRSRTRCPGRLPRPNGAGSLQQPPLLHPTAMRMSSSSVREHPKSMPTARPSAVVQYAQPFTVTTGLGCTAPSACTPLAPAFHPRRRAHG
jgi:hypothetical protein